MTIAALCCHLPQSIFCSARKRRRNSSAIRNDDALWQIQEIISTFNDVNLLILQRRALLCKTFSYLILFRHQFVVYTTSQPSFPSSSSVNFRDISSSRKIFTIFFATQKCVLWEDKVWKREKEQWNQFCKEIFKVKFLLFSALGVGLRHNFNANISIFSFKFIQKLFLNLQIRNLPARVLLITLINKFFQFFTIWSPMLHLNFDTLPPRSFYDQQSLDI